MAFRNYLWDFRQSSKRVILSEIEGSYAAMMASPAGCVRFFDYIQNDMIAQATDDIYNL